MPTAPLSTCSESSPPHQWHYLAGCVVLALLFLLFPTQAVSIAASITQYAIEQWGLALILTVSFIMILVLALAVSPWGRWRIGGTEAVPEFGFFSWQSMLFAAGMGSGLIFWGVAEPAFHFAHPPAFAQNNASPKDTALALTYFHWGLHAWAVYSFSGLAMAWFAYNRGRAMKVSCVISERRGDWLNFLAVIAVIFGVAGTLANSIALIQTGTHHALNGGWESPHFRFTLLVVITVIFTTSSILGLNRGIKRLSQFNMLFAIALLLVVIVGGSPWAMMKIGLSSTWTYITSLPLLSTRIDPASAQWSQNWSVICLVWWMAWAPFIGPFIARISYGRTVRQFLLCALLLPTLCTIIWFSAFAGGLFNSDQLTHIISAIEGDYTRGLFAYFETFPLGDVLSIAAMALLITFIITSADSAIYVTGLLTGSCSWYSKLAWSTILLAITAALIAQNNVDLNKQVAIIGALPFTLVTLIQVYFLLRDMYRYSRGE